MDVKQGRTYVREDSRSICSWYLYSSPTYVCATDTI
jgi:hypothetical protein